MKFFFNALRLITAIVIALIVLGGVAILSAKATGLWYMNHYGMPVDTDLSNDYGLGMLLMFVCGASLFIALPFVVFGAWKLSGRLPRMVLANPLFHRSASGGR